jgi:hypothetical protein
VAKDSRFKFAYRKNASKLHRAVGDVLRTDKHWKMWKAFQEYPVNKVNPAYSFGSHRFDWVIPSMKIVIECHGKQHYQVCDFGGGAEQAIEDFRGTKSRDHSKQMAALAAGWRYIVIPYTLEKKVTGDLLFDKLEEADKLLKAWVDQYGEQVDTSSSRIELEIKERNKAARKKYLQSQFHQEKLKKAKEFRRRQYQKMKEIKNETT